MFPLAKDRLIGLVQHHARMRQNGSLEQDSEDPTIWKFKRIIRHQGPLGPNHPDHKGSMHDVELEWENGETTLEPLATVGADDPVA